MSGDRSITFADLLSQKTWTDYGRFVSEAPRLYAEEVHEHVEGERELVRKLKEHPDFKRLTVRSVADRLDEANHLLMSGKGVGVDGTVARYRLFSGIRCQIGVVAVNYAGDKIQRSFFISEASIRKEPEDAIERIAGRMASDDALSDMAIRGLMLYREREAGLDGRFRDCHVMFHGPLLPFELMSGLGRLRALNVTLEILRRLVRERRSFSIISTTAYQDYLTFGRAIEPGEYLTASSYTLGHHLANSSQFLSYREKWREEERRTVEEFIRDYAGRILIGVIRIGERPYVFHAHEEIFDLAAAIIARDAMFQREKGFPLLIDYADAMCKEYFSSSEFRAMMEYELARCGAYLSEAPEGDLRLR
jgi:hypothetical protein